MPRVLALFVQPLAHLILREHVSATHVLTAALDARGNVHLQEQLVHGRVVRKPFQRFEQFLLCSLGLPSPEYTFLLLPLILPRHTLLIRIDLRRARRQPPRVTAVLAAHVRRIG